MTAQHTPRPWTVYHKHDVLQIDFGDNHGTRPCIVMWPGFDGNGLSKRCNLANARLIAAAPDLLEAATIVVNSLELVMTARMKDKDRAVLQSIVDELSPAIAKATGTPA